MRRAAKYPRLYPATAVGEIPAGYRRVSHIHKRLDSVLSHAGLSPEELQELRFVIRVQPPEAPCPIDVEYVDSLLDPCLPAVLGDSRSYPPRGHLYQNHLSQGSLVALP